MAISLKASSAWFEATADATMALVGTPVAGDRYFLWVAWKPYTVTCQVSGWTEIAEYADGAVAQGNGTGSMKVACYYRDWQSGDGSAAIDFSASPNISGMCLQLWTKSPFETWNTPLFATAPHASSAGAVTRSATSGTTAVPSGGVVMCLWAIADDSATFSRPTTGIDVASGITWNGNYVENPATHGNTTTANDMALDLGHRFVTTGGTVTLRASITSLSAAETGSILWAAQGVTALPPGDPMEDLTDDFATQDDAKWEYSAEASVSSGQLNLIASPPSVYSDSFTRANSTTSLGPDWTNRRNVMGIASNAAYPVTASDCTASYNTAMAGDDMYVEVIVTEVGSSFDAVNLILGANTAGEAASLYMSLGTAYVYTYTSWAATAVQQTTAAVPIATGDVVRFSRFGDAYTGFKNGVPVVSWSDTGNIVPRDSSHRLVAIGGFPFAPAYMAITDFEAGVDSGGGGGGIITSNELYDLTGSYAKIEVPQAANGGASTVDTQLSLRLFSDSDRLWMDTTGGNIRAMKTVGGSETQVASATYNSTTHRWWRISEASGTVSWDYSADGSSWTSLGTAAPGISISHLQPVLTASTASGGPYTALLDNFNNNSAATGTIASALQKALFSSGTGAQSQTGTIAASLQKALFAGNAGQAQSGSISALLKAAVMAANASQSQTGTISALLKAATFASTGFMLPSGAIASVIPRALFAGSGAQTQSGTVASTLKPPAASFTAEQIVTGVLASVMKPLTSSITGSEQSFSGVIDSHLQPATATLTGSASPAGTIVSSLRAATAALAGSQTQSGTLAAALKAALFNGTASQTQSGSMASTLQRALMNASGAQSQVGTLAATLKTTLLSASGSQTQSGSLGAAIHALTANLIGAHIFTGTVSASLRHVLMAASGGQTQAGTLAAALQKLTAALSGKQTHSGAIAAQIHALTADLTGSLQPSGALASALAHLLFDASAFKTAFPRVVSNIPATDREADVPGVNRAAEISAVLRAADIAGVNRSVVVSAVVRLAVIAAVIREANIPALPRQADISSDERENQT